MLPLRAAHLWQMLLNALFTSHLVRLIIGGRGKGHYFSLSLRGAQRLLSFSPLSPPPPCHAPKKILCDFFFFLRPLSSPPVSPLPVPGAPEEGGLGAVPPSKDPAFPPGMGPLHPVSDSIPDLPNAAESWYPREAEPDSLNPAAR